MPDLAYRSALARLSGLILAVLPALTVAQPPGPLRPSVSPPDQSLPVPRTRVDDFTSKRAAERFVEPFEQAELSLTLQVGHPRILQLRDTPIRVHLPDEETVRLDILDGEEGRILSLTGEQTGSTTFTLWFRDPDATSGTSILSYRLRVIEDPDRTARFEQLLADLQHDLNRSFPNSVVQLSYVGAEVLVRGKAKDIEEATQILRIISRSVPTDSQEERLRDLQGTIDDEFGIARSSAAGDAIQALLPLGTFSNPAFFDPDRIEQAGGLQGVAGGRNITGANAARINSRIVNMLEVAGVHQVQLKVTLAEVVREAGRSLLSEAGIVSPIGLDAIGGNGSQGIGFNQPGSLTENGQVAQFSGGNSTFRIRAGSFFLRFDALKRLGLARSLAEPNLTALNGQPALFLVGGQFPIQESISNISAVSQTIRFVPFGVQLSVVPTVTDGDRIRLNLLATISEREGQGFGTGQGGGGGQTGGNGQNGTGQGNDPERPPSLTTRSFSTTVELRDSESLAIAGLIRNSLTDTSVRVPFLGDIPYLGNLFSNKSTNYQEQELIVVVTPQLVSPVPAGRRPPLPGSDVFEPDDLDFFLHGRLTGSLPEDYRSPLRSDLEKMKAFRRAEQKYILGRPGHTSGQILPAPMEFMPPVEASYELAR